MSSTILTESESLPCFCSVCRHGLDCKYMPVDPYPFYPTFGKPFVYFAQASSGKENYGKKPNFFMRAFKWYTEEHGPPATSRTPGPFQDTCKDEINRNILNLTEFANWLDSKYEQFLQQNNDVSYKETKTMLPATNSSIKNIQSKGVIKTHSTKRKFLKLKGWKKHRVTKSLGRDSPKKSGSEYEEEMRQSSLHYLMPPKNLSRAVSECCFPTPSCCSVNKTIAKSQSETTLIEEEKLKPVKIDKPPPVEQKELKGSPKQNKTVHKDVSCQNNVSLADNNVQTLLCSIETCPLYRRETSNQYKSPNPEASKTNQQRSPSPKASKTNVSCQCTPEQKSEGQSQYQSVGEGLQQPTFEKPNYTKTPGDSKSPCPSLQIPCSAIRPCPTLREPCPSKVQSKISNFPESKLEAQTQYQKPEQHPSCPTYGEPCPSFTNNQDDSKTSCPRFRGPCPSKLRPCIPSEQQDWHSESQKTFSADQPHSYVNESSVIRFESRSKVKGQDVQIQETRKIEIHETETRPKHPGDLRPLPCTPVPDMQGARTAHTKCRHRCPRRQAKMQKQQPETRPPSELCLKSCQPPTEVRERCPNAQCSRLCFSLDPSPKFIIIQQDPIASQTRLQCPTRNEVPPNCCKPPSTPCLSLLEPCRGLCQHPSFHESCPNKPALKSCNSNVKEPETQQGQTSDRNTENNHTKNASQQNVFVTPTCLEVHPMLIGNVKCPFLAKMISENTCKSQVKETSAHCLCANNGVQTSDHAICLDKELAEVPFFMKIVCADKLK